jgi:hypothetical protein
MRDGFADHFVAEELWAAILGLLMG